MTNLRPWGTARYADVIDALNGMGLPTVFTQTGGMCAALEVSLEAWIAWPVISTISVD